MHRRGAPRGRCSARHSYLQACNLQCTVVVVFSDELAVDGAGAEVAVEDSVGKLHVGVFDGAVFGLVGDDGAGNLDDCFVAVLAALFDGGFCAVEFGLLAVNEDDGLRLPWRPSW